MLWDSEHWYTLSSGDGCELTARQIELMWRTRNAARRVGFGVAGADAGPYREGMGKYWLLDDISVQSNRSSLS